MPKTNIFPFVCVLMHGAQRKCQGSATNVCPSSSETDNASSGIKTATDLPKHFNPKAI